MDWDRYWKTFGIVALILIPFYLAFVILKAFIKLLLS